MEEKGNKQGISRRTFLKGTCTGIAAVAATSAIGPLSILASEKSETKTSEVYNADWIRQVPYQVDMKNVEPIPAVEEPAKYDYETDILIIGYGLGGTSCALTAVNEGCSVIALERSARHNWSEHAGVHTMGITGVKEWRDYHGITKWDVEEVDKVLDQIFPAGMSVADREASRINMLAGVEAFEQIRALGKGCTFELVEIFPEWAGYPTMIPTHEGDIEGGSIYYPWQNKWHAVEHRIHDYVMSKGGQVFWDTPALNLIQDKTGRVVGAKAEEVSTGKIIYVKAKAVIDCVGGIGANYDMIQYYGMFEDMLGCHVGTLTDDGVGMRLCQGAGAGVRGLPRQGAFAEGGIDFHKMNLPWTIPHDNPVTRKAGLSQDKTFSFYTYAPVQLARQPVLKTNKYGLRFENENDTWDAKVWNAFQQPGKRFYTFYDGNIENVVNELNKRYGMCERFITPNEYIYFSDDDIRPMYNWQDEFQDGLEKGFVIKADTLEELADKLGVNKENLLATVERYNHLCEIGVDEDYGKGPEFLFPIKEPPFYGMERVPAYLWLADGGIACDPYGRAMTEKAEIIPGLYCGANDARVTDHQTYTNLQQKPTCGGADFALTMGYLSAKAAAEDIRG